MSLQEGRTPLSQTTLPSIDLLTTTDKRDNDGPIAVPLHNLEKEGRL